ncbi:N-acetyltransferase [Paenibacillus sp. DMB20]|uniref:N-acetyltransferase n=1 Tax=Paenibacillus sp. DMB20 TaxID=1642570 RepID=UPI001F1BF80B|nr:N-acetyltransferase [Paenibacillus sp. DMB20]
MEIGSVFPSNPAEWPDIRRQCYEFMRRFGSKRLTVEGCFHLKTLALDRLKQPGTALTAVTVRGEQGRMPIGLSFAAGYGQTACLVAVHPLYRGRRIGTSLLLYQLSRLGRLRCKVAVDNIASLQMCFHAGMRAIALEAGPTGKPTLVMAGRSDESVMDCLNDSDFKQEGDRCVSTRLRNSDLIFE